MRTSMKVRRENEGEGGERREKEMERENGRRVESKVEEKMEEKQVEAKVQMGGESMYVYAQKEGGAK